VKGNVIKRILNIHGQYHSAGGAETYLKALTSIQKELGYEFEILFTEDHPPSGILACPKSYGLKSGFKALECFKDKIDSFNPDLIHFHVIQYTISPLVLGWIIKRHPCVMSMHDTLWLCLKPLGGNNIEDNARVLPDGKPCIQPLGMGCLGTGCVKSVFRQRRTYALADSLQRWWRLGVLRDVTRIMVNSEFTRQDLLRNGFIPNRIDVLSPDLNIPESWHSLERHLDQPPLLLYVGQLAPVKGVDVFLSALESLHDKSWHALIIGGGSASKSKKLRERVHMTGLESRVEIPGVISRDELGKFYSRASALVFPSLAPESLGLVGLEAMSMGVPVIGYNTGAVPEWLIDGVNGLLVNAGDSDALVHEMARLLDDKVLREQLSGGALKAAESWHKNVWKSTDLETVYQKAQNEWHAHRN